MIMQHWTKAGGGDRGETPSGRKDLSWKHQWMEGTGQTFTLKSEETGKSSHTEIRWPGTEIDRNKSLAILRRAAGSWMWKSWRESEKLLGIIVRDLPLPLGGFYLQRPQQVLTLKTQETGKTPGKNEPLAPPATANVEPIPHAEPD